VAQPAARPRVVVLVSGRGSNLRALLACDPPLPCDFVGVFASRPDAPALDIAKASGVPTEALAPQAFPTREAYDAALMQILTRWSPDWVVLAGYMRLLSEPILHAYARRIVNIHPSLLPAFPGLHPHRQALVRGVRVSGATVHLVEPGPVDGGEILAQASVLVYPEDTEKTLADRILKVEHRLYPKALRMLFDGRLRVAPPR
jgi:phosphoribosylglycinamide formyltransferase 1